MVPYPHRSELLPDWDGHRLRVRAVSGQKIGIGIDGCQFIALIADSSGVANLSLPYSPSGNARLGVQFTAQDSLEGTVTTSIGIEMNIPGMHPSGGAQHPLCALPNGQLVPLDARPMQREVAIVVPVYNAPEDVERCLDSVLGQTTGPSRLIVIDDASTDARIAPLLDRYRGINGVEILANSTNLGFTATVNRGIALAGDADVVLLNADTQVAANWLTGLRRALQSADDVATVTAVSDNAGAFSVPELEQENPFPIEWTFDQTALALWQGAGLAYPHLPTGNGFCMLIRREVIDSIGAFDVEAFPQGYGEENDFCQRASAAGFRHLIAGNVLVRHARSRSFGHERRAALGQAGMRVLRERWPRYEADVGASLFSFERRVLDWRVRKIYSLAPAHIPKSRLLCSGFDDHLALASGYDTFVLKPSDAGLELSHADNGPFEMIPLLDPTTMSRWLQQHAIDLIAIHSGSSDPVAAMLESESRRLGIPIFSCTATTDVSPEALAVHIERQRSFAGSRQ